MRRGRERITLKIRFAFARQNRRISKCVEKMLYVRARGQASSGGRGALQGGEAVA